MNQFLLMFISISISISIGIIISIIINIIISITNTNTILLLLLLNSQFILFNCTNQIFIQNNSMMMTTFGHVVYKSWRYLSYYCYCSSYQCWKDSHSHCMTILWFLISLFFSANDFFLCNIETYNYDDGSYYHYHQ